MWLKTVDGNYYNMLTGSTLSVQESRVGGEWRIYVMNGAGNTPLACLQDGFRSKDDADDALDSVMRTQEVTTIDVPEYNDEESEVDTDESEEDSDVVYEDNYNAVSDDDLRAELSNRELSTRGNTKQLVARLRRSDVQRVEEESK